VFLPGIHQEEGNQGKNSFKCQGEVDKPRRQEPREGASIRDTIGNMRRKGREKGVQRKKGKTERRPQNTEG